MIFGFVDIKGGCRGCTTQLLSCFSKVSSCHLKAAPCFWSIKAMWSLGCFLDQFLPKEQPQQKAQHVRACWFCFSGVPESKKQNIIMAIVWFKMFAGWWMKNISNKIRDCVERWAQMIEGQLFNTRALENQKEGSFGFQVLLHSPKLTWLAGNSPFSIGNTSSNGLCSIAMLAFEGISIFYKLTLPPICSQKSSATPQPAYQPTFSARTWIMSILSDLWETKSPWDPMSYLEDHPSW